MLARVGVYLEEKRGGFCSVGAGADTGGLIQSDLV